MHLSKHSILQLMSDIRRDNKCQQHDVHRTWITLVNVWWAPCTVDRLINCLRNNLSHINLFLLLICPDTKQCKTQATYLMMSCGPGPSEMQILGWTANPGMKLEEGAGGWRRRRRMRTRPPWCWGERQWGEWERGKRHSEYNYQLASMMTCPCEKPSFPHSSLPPSLFLSFFLSGLWAQNVDAMALQLLHVKPDSQRAIVNYHARLLLQHL